MKTRFISLMESPDASEGTEAKSNYSTERSPRTALLFEATRTVLLPLVQFVEGMPTAQELLERGGKTSCSIQE